MNNRVIYKTIGAALISAALISCNESQGEQVEPTSGSTITIATKSTDITSGDLLQIDNVTTGASAQYTYNGSSWSSSEPLVWPDDSADAVELLAYIVADGATSSTITLGAAGSTLDQQDALDNSDFLYYYNDAVVRSTSTSIDIDLEHKMAKVIVSVAVGNSGTVVSGLSMSSPASMSFEGGVWSPSSDNLTVAAHAEGTTYTMYVTPHTWQTPTVTLATDQGEIVASYDTAITLAAGKEYSIAIRTSTDSTTAQFESNFTVKDWGTSTNLGAASSAVVWDGTIAEGYGGGSGTADDPYLINDPSELAYMAWFVNYTSDTTSTSSKTTSYQNVYFEITADFDLNNLPWTPIGDDSLASFGGSIDGCDHTIYNMNVDTSSDSNMYAGLFGSCTAPSSGNGYIKNITLVDPTVVSTGQNTGAFIGYSQNYLALSNCSVIGGSVTNLSGANTKYVGGIIGNAFLMYNSITECKVIGTKVSGAGYHCVGGLAGRFRSGATMTGCVVSGVEVVNDAPSTNTNYCAGALIGEAHENTATDLISEITGCSVSGTVTCGYSYAGGLIGYSNSYPIITACYSEVTITGDSSYKGGLIGAMKVVAEFSEVNTNINTVFTTWQGGSAIGVVFASSSSVTDPLDGDNNGSMKVNDIGSDEQEAMNTALDSAGYSWEFVASSLYEGIPYILQSKN